MNTFLLVFGFFHLMAHVVPSVIMLYHAWHMHKFHSISKWKLIGSIFWMVISLLTMFELPAMVHSLGKC